MSLREVVFGRPIPDSRAGEERVGTGKGVPLLGLDALASAAYGPEAALTALLPLGAAAPLLAGPITAAIVAVLVLLTLSYRQTIAAYPGGGGSYTVAHENLGRGVGLLAAAALSVDYVLNVAVAISAGVGAVVSAVPRLLPLTLPLALVLLALITVVNLRGIRSAGTLFSIPTWLFVASLGTVLVVGAWRALAAGGHPAPAVAPPPLAAAAAATPWLVLRAFANGCTAMTGVEAVSNGVPLFREPRVRVARRTLTVIVAILVALLAGVALLARAYGVGATEPGSPGYQSVLAQLVAAVAGRGPLFGVTMASVFAVLCLSANTSFADFPRVCRVLALDGYLPSVLAHSGPRLVLSAGIAVLSTVAGLLLVAFGGITDRLIPLFAVGALSAFTLSQAGMVAHWRRSAAPGARRSMALNAAGAVATGATLAVVAVTKFTEGAWLTVLLVPALALGLRTYRRRRDRADVETAAFGPFIAPPSVPPLVMVPVRTLDRVTRKALSFAMGIASEVEAVEVRLSDRPCDDLERAWPALVERPARDAGLPAPRLVTLRSSYRELADPILAHIRRRTAERPDRFVAVVVPERVRRRWYHALFPGHSATLLRTMLIVHGGPQVVVVEAPWHLREPREVTAGRAPSGAASARPRAGTAPAPAGRAPS